MILLPIRSSCLKMTIWIAPEVRPDEPWTFFAASSASSCTSPLGLCHQMSHTITAAAGRWQPKYALQQAAKTRSCAHSAAEGDSSWRSVHCSLQLSGPSQVCTPHESHKEEEEKREESLVETCTQMRRQILCRFLLCKHELSLSLERKGSHQAVLPHIQSISASPPAWLKAAFY